MSRRLTTQEFITKSNSIHKNKYLYPRTNYINAHTKVIITCPIDDHCNFEQKPYLHLQGQGCPKCGGRIKLNNMIFKEKSNIKHHDKYIYDEVNYINNKTKVKVLCPKEGHGAFYQTPNDHLNGIGCPKCGHNILTQEEVIRRFKIAHPNGRYIYSKVEYVNTKTKVIITCPIHDDFKQTPANHLNGNICPICSNINNEGVYHLSKALQGHYKFSGYLYKIKMFNNHESFVKIGVSINCKERFYTLKSQSNHIYNIIIIKTKFYKDFNQAIIKEHKLHNVYKEHSYNPKSKFGGHTECFTEEIL